jgi:hypothetical protein
MGCLAQEWFISGFLICQPPMLVCSVVSRLPETASPLRSAIALPKLA